MKLKQHVSKKEDFLNLLREMNVYVKEDVKKEIKDKIETKIEQKLEEVIPKKKLFKHENTIHKLKEVHYSEL